MNIPVQDYWALLIAYLRPQRRRVVLLALLLLTGIGLQLLNPQLIRYVIDSALSKGPIESVMLAAVIFFILAAIQQVANVLTTYVGQTIAWTATNNLRHDLAEHALNLDQSYHNVHTPGEMIERLDGDITILSNFFSQFTIQLVGNGILIVGILLVTARENWRVGLGLSVYAIVALYIFGRIRNIGGPYWKRVRQVSGELYGFIEERLAGTQDIRANGATDYIMRRFYELAGTILRAMVKASLATNMMVNGAFILFAVGSAIAFALGAYLFREGLLTIGTVYVIFYYTTLMNRPMDMITQQLADLQQAVASISRVNDLKAVKASITEGTQDYLPPGPLAVSFDHIIFGYAADEIILNDFELKLEAGRVLGLLGRTGSGKTTLARLLLRLYDPQAGVIRLNDNDLRDFRFATLRQHVSMVTQNVQLFHATVRENLTLFDPTISDEQILQAISDLNLGSWFESLENGLNTQLAYGGASLSAGEAQLLAFARIFLKNPGLVILDEASSRLDPLTEQIIERAMDRLIQGRTTIIIAHRLATVDRADEILIMEAGAIAEYGDREQLARDPESRFHRLLRTSMQEVLV